MDKKKRFNELYDIIYKHHSAGGLLHIILDDYNVENHWLSSTYESVSESTDEEMKPIYFEMLLLLYQFTFNQRLKLLQSK